MPNANLGPLDCFWRELGHGSRRAHFIHCSLATSKSLMGLMTELEDLRAITAIDLPGHGRTAAPVETIDMQRQSTDASIALLEQSGSAIDLVGHSFGATVALRVAAERPDLVRSLVLFEPVFFGLLEDLGAYEFEMEMQSVRKFDDLRIAGDTMAAAAEFLGRWGLPGEWDRLPAAQRQYIADNIWLVGLNNKSLSGPNPERMRLADIRGIKMPALVVHGALSPPIMPAISAALSAEMEHATGVEISQAGHMVPITHAKECAELVRDFWDGKSENAGTRRI